MGTCPQVIFRIRVCRGPNCGITFAICRSCDRGQRYCSQPCRWLARRQQHRAANRRYQQSPEGKLDHRDRMRRWRLRRAQSRVTDQGSFVMAGGGSIVACTLTAPVVSATCDRPAHQTMPDRRAHLLCCIICRRTGRFVDPFPLRR